MQRRATTPAQKSRHEPPALAESELTAAELDLHVGQRIRRRREALNITQSRLARHLGVTFSQVQKYEKGANRIGAGRLYLTAAFLGVPVRYFFEGLDKSANGRAPHAGATGAEISALEEAFQLIRDPETRGSVVALVCSLATTAGHPEKPRQNVA